VNPSENEPAVVKHPPRRDDTLDALLDALRGIERALNAMSARIERLPKEVAAELARLKAAARTRSDGITGLWSASDGLPGS